jgi:hypothetical protein
LFVFPYIGWHSFHIICEAVKLVWSHWSSSLIDPSWSSLWKVLKIRSWRTSSCYWREGVSVEEIFLRRLPLVWTLNLQSREAVGRFIIHYLILLASLHVTLKVFWVHSILTCLIFLLLIF